MVNTTSCEMLGAVCKIIVGIQFLIIVLPWLYRNILGPRFIGSSVAFKKGSWAGMCNMCYDIILHNNNYIFFFTFQIHKIHLIITL